MNVFQERKATLADAEFIVALHGLPHANGTLMVPELERVRTRLADTGYEQRIVLDERGEPIAFWMAERETPWLAHFLVVATREPRRGAGRFAVERCIAWAFDDSATQRLYLEVTAANVAARTLYERCGFVHEGTFREGFRSVDGTVDDLCAYGMLRRERPQ